MKVKLSLCVIKFHIIKTYGFIVIFLHAFLFFLQFVLGSGLFNPAETAPFCY